jgi:hypothetical protein
VIVRRVYLGKMPTYSLPLTGFPGEQHCACRSTASRKGMTRSRIPIPVMKFDAESFMIPYFFVTFLACEMVPSPFR